MRRSSAHTSSSRPKRIRVRLLVLLSMNAAPLVVVPAWVTSLDLVPRAATLGRDWWNDSLGAPG
jgi:hypothetical protein